MIRSVDLLLLILFLATCACGDSKLDISTPAMERGLPDETSRNVTITEFDRDGIAYILEAGRIDRYYDRRILNAFEVDITAWDSEGKKTVMKADSTIVDDARNQVFAYGNVELSSPGVKVITSRMTWDRNMDEIVAPDRVTLIREGNILRGKNLRTTLSIYPTEMDSISAEGYFGEEYLDW
ncbi:MAG: LPS export ABC transporter periplasmic protein LptC [Candidatus Syntrophosphaera sp.]